MVGLYKHQVSLASSEQSLAAIEIIRFRSTMLMLLPGKGCAFRGPNLVTSFEDSWLCILYEGLDTRPCPAAICFSEVAPQGAANDYWSHIDLFSVFE